MPSLSSWLNKGLNQFQDGKIKDLILCNKKTDWSIELLYNKKRLFQLMYMDCVRSVKNLIRVVLLPISPPWALRSFPVLAQFIVIWNNRNILQRLHNGDKNKSFVKKTINETLLPVSHWSLSSLEHHPAVEQISKLCWQSLLCSLLVCCPQLIHWMLQSQQTVERHELRDELTICGKRHTADPSQPANKWHIV